MYSTIMYYDHYSKNMHYGTGIDSVGCVDMYYSAVIHADVYVCVKLL